MAIACGNVWHPACLRKITVSGTVLVQPIAPAHRFGGLTGALLHNGKLVSRVCPQESFPLY